MSKRTKKPTRRQKMAANPDGSGNSRYARKVQSGRQMYGPGCCGHQVKSRRCGVCRKITALHGDCHWCRAPAKPRQAA